MNIPLEFVSFAMVEGKMYKHHYNQSTFVIPLNTNRRWGNAVVYGGIFLLRDFEFYIRLLDAYHVNSMSAMMRNHRRDVHHRVDVMASPIYFSTLDDLKRLKYREGEPLQVQMYTGNPNHPKINQRLQTANSYRVIDGVDANQFKQLYREVSE